MPFTYHRTIRFADTDAAGVVFFPNYLAICHEAYEESLLAAGIELKSFFSEHEVIVPIAKSQADYLRELRCGDRVRVTFAVEILAPDTYALRCELFRLGSVEKLAARVRTEHICISSANRERRPLPPAIAAWARALV